MTGDTPRPPAIQRVEGVGALIRDDAAVVFLRLVEDGIAARESAQEWRDGGRRARASSLHTLRDLLKHAITPAVSADGHADVRREGARASSSVVIDSAEAARILGRSPRQVTRIARDLDGVLRGRSWWFDRTVVETYRDERQERRNP